MLSNTNKEVKILNRLKQLIKDKKKVYAFIILSIITIFIITVFTIFLVKYTPLPQQVILLNINSTDSIITFDDNIVPPVLYQKMPNMKPLETQERKERFIDLMLPTILVAQEIINQHRNSLTNSLKNSKDSKRADTLLLRLMHKFKAKDYEDLISRMQPHPISIILAQAAVESGWGTSRFCRKANNLFGIWSFNKKEKRVAAGTTRDKKTIYLRKYDSLIESVIDYIYTIGRASAFNEFRETRLISQNPYRLIWCLNNYSEKRFGYIITLRNMIEHNDLTRYDNYPLAKIDKKDKTWKRLVEEY